MLCPGCSDGLVEARRAAGEGLDCTKEAERPDPPASLPQRPWRASAGVEKPFCEIDEMIHDRGALWAARALGCTIAVLGRSEDPADCVPPRAVPM